MNITSGSVRRVVGAYLVLAMPFCWAGVADGGDDAGDLARLVRADGEEYVRLRDTLLEHHAQAWDVTGAAPRSWEMGLATFILNQRTAQKEAFACWDPQTPRLRASGQSYDLSSKNGVPDTADAAVAFLLERMWKRLPIPGWTEMGDQKWAYEDYLLGYREPWARAGQTALWKAMWEQAEDERFRLVAILHVCADPDPSVQPIIVEVLDDENDELPDARPVASKYRCLLGLRHRDTEETVDAILQRWDRMMLERAWVEKALAALCANSSERARRFLYGLALNENHNEWLRAGAARDCCFRSHPDDPDMFRKFFAGPGSNEMKSEVLRSIGGSSGCPRDAMRPLLREIITTADNESMTTTAAMALSSYLYSRDAVDDARILHDPTVAEDLRLLEEVSQRPNLSPSGRFIFSGMISNINERRERAKPKTEGP